MGSKIKLKSESLPVRCEICHQSDYFDAKHNYCLRCANTSKALHLQAKDNPDLSTMGIRGLILEIARMYSRMVAGVWFALSGLIPVAFYLSVEFHEYLFERLNLEITIYNVIIPVLLAGAFGALLGSSIIKEQKTKNSDEAVLRGFSIAVLSFVFYAIIYALIFSKKELSLERFFISLYVVLFWGGILVGWLVGITGSIAGWLLYKLFQNKKEA